MKHPGKFLKIARKNAGLSLHEVSQRTELTVEQIKNYENGKTIPSHEALDDITKVIGLPLAILQYMVLEKKDVPTEKQETFKKIDPVAKKLIGQYFLK